MAPGGLYWPAAHTNCVALVDPAAQKYPAVQLLHRSGDGSDGVVLYRPAGQGEHDDWPANDHWPGSHDTFVSVIAPGRQ